MKKILSAFFLLAAILISSSVWGQPWSENFDSGLAGSYTTGIQTLSSGDWYTTAVYLESSGASYEGSAHAARLNDDTNGASLRTPAMNTVGTISFYYRELNSGGGTFSIEKSYDNSSWTQLTTQTFSGSTFTEFTYDVNDGAATIYIRVVSDDQPGHLIIDNFSVSSYSASSGPAITNITHLPASPTNSDAVSISADITDTDGIGGAEIHWGTTSGSLTNTIGMSSSSGDTYTTDSDIPAQSAGTTVYYEVYVLDNNLDETTSSEQSYEVTTASSTCGSEDFSNAGNSSSYGTINWTGLNSVGWNATDARSDQDLDGNEAVMLRNGSLTNTSSVSGGCGIIEFDYAQIYSGGSTLKVFINSTQYGGDINVSSTSSTHFSATVNETGNINIEIENSGNRTLVSNLEWSCYASVEPGISLSESSLTGFTYEEGSGPSAEQSFTVEGSNLTNDISMTAPANYEISETSGSGFGSSVTLTQSGGSVSTTTIYVRLKSGLSVSTYNGETITATSTGATNQTVTCDGEVTCPSVSAPTATSGSSIGTNSFTANWNAVSGVTGYELDVYSSVGTGSELVLNGGFETGDNSDWSKFEDDYEVLTSDGGVNPHSGSYMLKCFATGTRDLAQDITFTADGTSQYEVSFWYRYASASDPEALRIWASFDSGSYTGDDLQPDTYLPAIDTWTKVTYTITPASGSNTLHLELRSYSSGQIYIDDISFRQASGTPTYHLQNENVGNVTSYAVSGLTTGETYYYVVRAYNGCSNESVNSNEITVNLSCNAPTTEASSLSFNNIATDQMDISWTIGDGENHLVVASTSPITAAPSDNTSYNANPAFGSGDDIGSSEFVVYAGSGNSFTMTGLLSSTEYYIKVFEYNCDGGNEKYLAVSPLNDSQSTLSDIPAVTNLDVTCQTTSTATVSWTIPTGGDWDGVVIAIRNDNNPAHTLSDDPSSITADPVFGNGHEFGTTTPYSYVVYKGTGNSVTITGLTQGEEYSIKAYSFFGNTYDGITTTTINSLQLGDVSSAHASAGNAETTISWANPFLCYDEILVAGHSGSSVISSPSGDGTSYSANGIFGNGTDIGSSEYVLYKGTSTNVNVTGLTNGTTYYFTIFVRKGSEWSSGIEVSVTPSDVTYFNPGELIIIGFDAAVDASSADKIYLTNLVEMKPGTEFLYVNSRFEAGAAAGVRTNEWHGGGDDPDADPGIINITYNGASSIPAGSIISYEIEFSTPYSFEINGVSSSDFTATSNGTAANISTSSGDQTWLLQGVFTDQGNYHTLDGNVLYGLTSREAWVDLSSAVSNSSDGSQRESRLHPDTKCFNLSLASSQEYAYYKNGTGGTPGIPAHDGAMRDILIDIMDGSNWEIGTGGNTLDIPEDFSDCDISNNANAIGRAFCISSGLNGSHNWYGDISSDWFDCANWESLHVPNEETNVIFNSDICSNDIELTNEDTAKCMNITFQGTGAYSLYAYNGSDKVLDIYGDLTINTTDAMVFDDFDSGTTDGTLIIRGNWNNQAGADGFWQGNSSVYFMGTSTQSITSSAGSESFHNFHLDANANTSLNSIDLNIENQLTLTNGLIVTGSNKVNIENTDATAITGYSNASYINGNLRRNVAGTTTVNFPVGDASNYELASIAIDSETGLTYMDAHFTSSDLGSTSIGGLGLQIDNTPLVSVLDAGYWQVEPNTGATVIYDIILNESGASNAASIAEQHAVIKRDDAISDWELQGNHDNSTQSISGGIVTAQVSSLSEFSQFAIARSQTNVLAVELTDFSVNCTNAGILVEWSTASEDNSDYFMIEYSSDTKEWQEINKILAFGTTNIRQDYQLLLEDSPRIGYYRLSEIDTDGKMTSYAPQYTNCMNENGKVEFILAPNPAHNMTRISASETNADLYIISIFDTRGRIVNTLTWIHPEESSFELDLSEYPAGLYNLKIYNESEFHSLKLIIE